MIVKRLNLPPHINWSKISSTLLMSKEYFLFSLIILVAYAYFLLDLLTSLGFINVTILNGLLYFISMPLDLIASLNFINVMILNSIPSLF